MQKKNIPFEKLGKNLNVMQTHPGIQKKKTFGKMS